MNETKTEPKIEVCGYCEAKTYADGECETCGWTGTCIYCGETVEPSSPKPTVCGTWHCLAESRADDPRW